MNVGMTELDKMWVGTCRSVLGGEIGGLEDSKAWLKKGLMELDSRKSSLSGKDVWLAKEYANCENAIAYDEAAEYGKNAGVVALDIKDIDSLIEASKGKFAYSGGKILGNSAAVGLSERCVNSSFVHGSCDIFESKYVAYSDGIRYSEAMFGTSFAASSKFSIRVFDCRQAVRCVECIYAHYSSDCYFCGNIENCRDCLFSFNMRNKTNCIGNLQLSQPEYIRLKAKLLLEIRELLAEGKEAPSIFDIIGKGNAGHAKHKNGKKAARAYPEIEEAFGSATNAVLGRKLTNLDGYGEWLMRNVPKFSSEPSAHSGRAVLVPAFYWAGRISGRYIKKDEEQLYGRKAIRQKEAESLSLANAQETLTGISFISPEIELGRNIKAEYCAAFGEAAYCYFGSVYSFSKYCAFCFWPRESEYVFGSDKAFSCKFCIKCSNSENLTRCFEVDSSSMSSDCYFCHNVENCQDCMFSFNVKNKKYAIGNAEYPRDDYLKFKQKILAQIADELEKTHSLKYDIYNIGCICKKKTSI